MNKIISFFMSVITFISGLGLTIFGNNQNKNPDTDSLIMPSTWAAVDMLGRTLPSETEVGKKDDKKFVGMFYWTWHTLYARYLKAQNITEILKEHPEIINDINSPLWPDGGRYYPYYWGEPIWGYYQGIDAYVLRKNAELLADAGVDVIIFDATNETTTWDEDCLKLFEIFEEAKKDGVNVPQIAYMLPFNEGPDTTTSLKHLYNDIYSQEKYQDLWFYWDKKPLIMAHSEGLNKKDELESKILDFFTFRENDGTYFSDDREIKEKVWGWCSDYPQAKYGTSKLGSVEEMCVSVSQNAADGKLCAQNASGNVQGRSFTHGDYSYSYTYGGKTITVDKNIENSDFYGLNFQQQWDYALKCDPNFIFIDGWNEWTASRFANWEGTTNAFPDQFNDEHSRDIEPTNGRLKDSYYYQLCANIRKFKGTNERTIINNGAKEYYHYTNSTYNRDCDGWVGLHYTNNTMRNDFVKVSVRNNSSTIYLTVECKDNITPYTDKAWMRVLFDTDTSGISTNWEGFEYILNRTGASSNTVSIEKSTGGWNFEKIGDVKYTVNGKTITYEIPISVLGMSKDNIHFNFKLSDNMQNDGDILDFYKNGDVAPGGRFTFVY